jgi:hypothetical protein
MVALLAILAIVAVATAILVATGLGSTVVQSLQPYPQIVGKNCGAITAGEGGRAGDFTSSEQCLWNAYETCQAATLVYNNAGLDFTVTHAVSLQKHGESCTVTDATQGNQDGSLSQPTRNTYHCRGIEQQARGLVILGCGAEGNVTIPASPSLALGQGRGSDGDWRLEPSEASEPSQHEANHG